MKKIARRNFLKLVGVSASIPILQSLPIASASATDLSDYPLLKDGIFDFENTDITQYVDDVQEVFGSEKDMIEEMLSSGELTRLAPDFLHKELNRLFPITFSPGQKPDHGAQSRIFRRPCGSEPADGYPGNRERAGLPAK